MVTLWESGVSFPTSPVDLQASWQSDNSSSLMQWQIVPIGSSPGYYTIRQSGSYLGNMQTSYDDQSCAFAFVKGAQQGIEVYKGKLIEMFTTRISSVQIKYAVKTSTGAEIFIKNTQTGSQTFHFNRIQDAYQIIDILNQDYGLAYTGVGTPLVMSKINGGSSTANNHLWRFLTTRTKGCFTVVRKIDTRNCLGGNFNTNNLELGSCTVQNSIKCTDHNAYLIDFPTCTTKTDKMCYFTTKLPNGQFVREKPYPCSTGVLYCKSSSSGKLNVQPTGWSAKDCLPQYDINLLHSWSLLSIDPSQLNTARNNQIKSNDLPTAQIGLFNVGYQQFVCQDEFYWPFLCSNPSSKWNLHTFSRVGKLNDPFNPTVGYMIEGTEGNKGFFLTGIYDESNNQVESTSLFTTKGHFWAIVPVGYNVYQLKYGWGGLGDSCLTPDPKNSRARASTKYEGKILHRFKRCDPQNPDQLWSFIE